MSGSTSASKSMATGGSLELLKEMAAILVAAVALGVVYNSASPLGIRAPTGLVVEPIFPADVTPLSALPTTESDSSIQNETIQALVVPDETAGLHAGMKALPAAVAWREVKPLLAAGKIILVDVRDTQAYALGHIPGAVSLPMDQVKDKLGEFVARYPKSTPLVIYCASVRCQSANAQARVLTREHGYVHVREMPGGYAEWRVSEPQAEPAVAPAP
ncbi:rhodanese-like domain-containing protein [Roseimicrobium sp. ORNL1]|uniref:rhodanese-like domain-containing protein n=1 Tax=Roseimicrobium sp. ORNL1 TaxID=2711231 RepID=UPI0013E2090F|nr:rhodanese-like domain-containing protein [Roseimicrobium sp. ORNL1]QIF05180.1 rhodanese-like domain-containing protein [Roseimicrobium sp. ORNL1]